MTAGGPDIVHGAQIPSPPWWRPLRNVPLIMLAIASLIAAIVGWTASYVLANEGDRPAATSVDPGVSVAGGSACRLPIEAPRSEPWIDGDGSAEAVWQDNDAERAAPVILGRDGWAFYNDQVEENFSQSLGRRYLTAQQAEAWNSYFATVASALGEQGIEFSIQITPSATSVYPDQLPAWTDGLRGSTPLDQMLATSPELPIVDFRAALQEAASTDAVFTPVNSHWTDWGGYVGWRTFADCRTSLGGPDSWMPAVSGVESDGIFNEYAPYGVADAVPEWTRPLFAVELAPVTVRTASGEEQEREGERVIDLTDLPASTENAASHSAQTALILRDSMGNALSPYWGQEFAITHQIQHRYDDWSTPPNYRALVDQYQPDVVIVQMAERHLINAPPAGVSNGY